MYDLNMFYFVEFTTDNRELFSGFFDTALKEKSSAMYQTMQKKSSWTVPLKKVKFSRQIN